MFKPDKQGKNEKKKKNVSYFLDKFTTFPHNKKKNKELCKSGNI